MIIDCLYVLCMKKYFVIFVLVLMCINSVAQSYVEVDFSKSISKGYYNGKLDIPKDLRWTLDISKLNQSIGSARVNEDEKLEIVDLNGELSVVIEGVNIIPNKPYLISFDISSLSSPDRNLEHIEYVGVIYTDKLCFSRISKGISNKHIQLSALEEREKIRFDISFQGLDSSCHYLLDNIKVHRYIENSNKSIPDTTSLIYSQDSNKYLKINKDYVNQKIFSFIIEDAKYGSDNLSTIISKLKIDNVYKDRVSLEKLLSDLQIFCDGEKIDNCGVNIINNQIVIDFGKDGFEIKSDTKRKFEIYANINSDTEIASGTPFMLKISRDMIEVSNLGSQFAIEQFVISPHTVISPLVENDIMFTDNFTTYNNEKYINLKSWIIKETKINESYIEHCLQSNPKTNNKNYFSTIQEDISFDDQDVIWSVDISNGDWNPSSSNRFCFFTMSDVEDFSNKVSGYAIGVDMDGHDDILCLYRVDKGRYTRICETSFVWKENSVVNICVRRTNTGDWSISYNDDIASTIYKGTVKCHDKTYNTGKYTGVNFNYTSSRSKLLYIDNYEIQVSKLKLGVVEKFFLDENDNICLKFNKDVNQSDILLKANYMLSTKDEDVEISNVEFVNNTLVIHTKLITGEYYLTISNIHNNKGEQLTIEDIYFEYLSSANKGDIVINELMLNPKDGEYEYLELYNTKDYEIDLSNAEFSYNGKVKDIIEDISIPANGYLLLSSVKAHDYLVKYGNVYSLKSFVLNNESASICIKYPNGIIVDTIKYTSDWYDPFMPKRGVSLEKVVPTGVNNNINWTSSKNKEGGTPGGKNNTKKTSVSGKLIDVQVISTTSIKLVFNKALDVNAIKDKRLFMFRPSEFFIIEDLELQDNNNVIVRFKEELERGKDCSIEIYGILDCDKLKIHSKLQFSIPMRYMKGDILINEVLLKPSTGGHSFIEVYNNTSCTIDLSQISISLNAGENIKISDKPHMFKPESYAVFTFNKESILRAYTCGEEDKIIEVKGFPTSIEESEISIVDSKNVLIDNMFIYETITNKITPKEGYSFERISLNKPTNDKDNWKLCEGKRATPALKNSESEGKESIEFTVENRTFKPRSTGEDNCFKVKIKNKGKTVRVTMNIYNIRIGKIVRTVVEDLEVISEALLKWDGRDDLGNLVSTTNYLVVIDIIHFDDVKETKKYVCCPCR